MRDVYGLRELLIDYALSLDPLAVSKTSFTRPCESIQPSKIVLSCLGPFPTCQIKEEGIVFVSRMPETKSASIFPLTDPVIRMLRVAVSEHLLIGHSVVAKSGTEQLPVSLIAFFRLDYAYDVVFGGQYTAWLVESGDNDLGTVVKLITVPPLASCPVDDKLVIQTEYVAFPGNESGVRETCAGLSHDCATKAVIPPRAFVQLVEIRPCLPGARWPGKDDLGGVGGLEVEGMASEFRLWSFNYRPRFQSLQERHLCGYWPASPVRAQLRRQGLPLALSLQSQTSGHTRGPCPWWPDRT